MDAKKWLEKIGRGDAPTGMAEKAGLYRGTFSRQYNAGKIPPNVIVAIARAYKADPLEGLIACGLLDRSEVEARPPMPPQEFLATFSDLDLLKELVARIESDGEQAHPLVVAPLDEHHPAIVEPDFSAMAAHTVDYDPDEEAEADPFA